MGEYSEEFATYVGDENHGQGETKAHHVGISPQEDRGGTKGTVGCGQGAGEEGGLGQL
jgi:hypothetical protein